MNMHLRVDPKHCFHRAIEAYRNLGLCTWERAILDYRLQGDSIWAEVPGSWVLGLGLSILDYKVDSAIWAAVPRFR